MASRLRGKSGAEKHEGPGDFSRALRVSAPAMCRSRASKSRLTRPSGRIEWSEVWMVDLYRRESLPIRASNEEISCNRLVALGPKRTVGALSSGVPERHEVAVRRSAKMVRCCSAALREEAKKTSRLADA